jgi:hypothetical protein
VDEVKEEAEAKSEEKPQQKIFKGSSVLEPFLNSSRLMRFHEKINSKDRTDLRTSCSVPLLKVIVAFSLGMSTYWCTYLTGPLTSTGFSWWNSSCQGTKISTQEYPSQILTFALSESFPAMILVLSNILSPGPKAMQVFTFPLQVLDTKSHSSPVSMQMGPLVFGETSPKFDEAKAPTNSP